MSAETLGNTLRKALKEIKELKKEVKKLKADVHRSDILLYPNRRR